MKELQKAIKENNFNKFNLFSGCEEHLKDHYAQMIVKSVLGDTNDSFNYLKMFSDVNYDSLVNYVYSPPVFKIISKGVYLISNISLYIKS